MGWQTVCVAAERAAPIQLEKAGRGKMRLVVWRGLSMTEE
jgi:hypothetical protein